MLDWFVKLNQRAIYMRELTLLETGYLAGLAFLSLVLPLMMSFRGPVDAPARKCCMKTVWTGLILLVIALLTVRASAPLAPYAAAFGLVSCTACAFVLHRQFRATRPA